MGASTRDEILKLVERHFQETLGDAKFRPGIDWVPVSGKSFGPLEMQSLVAAALEFDITAGLRAQRFAQHLNRLLGMSRVLLTNSGSSANLLAVATLCSKSLRERRLLPGHEVITAATGFPTTLNPILQHNLTAVLVDAEPGTYNPSVASIEAALGPKTRALFLAHTLGNPVDLDRIRGICHALDLYLVEDSCDALGSSFLGQPAGSWGHLSTFSFYPAHHITTGEGGALACASGELARVALSLRDWGRHCWCQPGQDNTCGKRYDWSFPGLPSGIDHKYVYSEIGYNLKLTDLQSALGEVQVRRLGEFEAIRNHNFHRLNQVFKQHEDWFILPRSIPGAKPSWFGYPVTIREEAPFTRTEMISYLDSKKIATRMIFAGNLQRQPAYENHPGIRISGDLLGSDTVLKSSFWLGVCQAIDDSRLDYMCETLHEWLRSARLIGR